MSELCKKGCDEEEAEELFATALEKVMASVDPIDRDFSTAQMVNFIKRACWRCFIDERRRRGVRTEVSLSSVGPLDDSAAESPAEAAEEREAVAVGKEALKMLSERDRVIFRQRHQMNLSPKEILQNTPGLSLRTYRKIIQRANATVLEAYDRIQTGERCEELESGLLRRHLAEQTSGAERRAVEAHLAHCRVCQLRSAEMRDYLVDVASGTLVAAALAGSGPHEPLGDFALRLADHASGGAHALLGASKAARERIRDTLFRLATGLPGGPGGESASFGQALTAPSVKVASVCAAGLAAGACVASGVVPGIGAVDLLNQQHHQARHHAQPARYSAPAAAEPAYLAPALPSASAAAPEAEASTSSGSAKRGRSKAGGGAGGSRRRKQRSSSSGSPTSAQTSSRQTGTEFGFESGTSSSTPSTSSTSSSSSSSSGSSTSGSGSTGSGSEGSGGSTPSSPSGSGKSSSTGSEFGF